MAGAIDLKDRVAIVTGGSQGLGFEMALGLARAGARVTIASPDRQNLEKSAAEIGKDRCLAVVADIRQKEDCRRILDETLARFGDCAILVNNARRNLAEIHTTILQADPDFWQASVMVNVYGTFLMTWTVLPHLLKRGWGRVVNVTTSLDTIQRARNAPYGVTKAAIETETTIWAKELAGSGVTVNSLLPGGACDIKGGRTRPSASGGPLLPPDVMVEAMIWLASNLSDGQTGGRYVGKFWDKALAPSEAAAKCFVPPVFRELGAGDE